MISLTIDEKTVEVPEGTTVLRAAEKAGVKIPTLCDHPALPPYGGCRLCVVEVQGFRTPIASCTLPVSSGMVVNTDTDKLRSIRKFVLTMLFSERNHFCPFCQKTGGDCELQNAAYGEEMSHWPIMPNWSPFTVDASHPNFILDHNRCILCRRCVRACANLTGNFTLDMENRGARTLVVADYGLPMGESSCVRCGSCVQACPTGALIERSSAYQGLEEDAVAINTICTACSVGCGITYLVRDNRIIRVLGDWEAPVNAGVLCALGRYKTLEDSRTRITAPMVRKSGGLAPVTWDEAIATVCARLQTASGNLAALASSRLPAESLFSFKNLFAEKLGAANGKGVVASIEEGLTSASVDDKLSGSLEDLKNSDCVMLVGADLVKSHQVAGFFIKRNRPKGVTIIVIDPYKNETETVAHYYLKNMPGSDEILLKGLLAGVVNMGLSKNDAADADPKMISEAASESGIPAETMIAVSRELGSAKAPVIIFGKGVTRSTNGNLHAMEELARATGARLINPMGKANSAAAHAYGLDKHFDPIGREVIFLALGDDFPTPRLIDSLPEEAFLVVQTSYSSALTEKADVVLPVEMWAEQSGSYLNLEGRLQKTTQVLQPAPMVRSNQAVFESIAQSMGVEIDQYGTEDVPSWQSELRRKL